MGKVKDERNDNIYQYKSILKDFDIFNKVNPTKCRVIYNYDVNIRMLLTEKVFLLLGLSLPLHRILIRIIQSC